MQGGTIGGSDDTAVNTAKSGGGVYVDTNGALAMSGSSLIDSNGVHVLGTITMEGGARVIKEWVYLTSGTFITLTGDMTGAAPVAVIYPQNTSGGIKVLGGDPPLIPNNKAKFSVDIGGSAYPPPASGSVKINDNGKLL
jgi:hypothetical protein